MAMILHSSGVTRRGSELDFASEAGIEVRIVDDFVQANDKKRIDQTNIENSIKSKLKTFFRFSSSIFGFKLFFDPPDFFVRSWTSEIRCHYYKRRISIPVLNEIQGLLLKYGLIKVTLMKESVVHYRLGDLVSLDSKSPIPNSRIKNGLRMASTNQSMMNWIVASDSPHLVENLLRDESAQNQMTIYDGSAWQTLDIFSRSSTFVASYSKLSLWGILLGISLGFERKVFLPVEMLRDVVSITQYTSKTTLIPY